MIFVPPFLKAAVLGLSVLNSALALPTQLERRNLPVTFQSTHPVTFHRAVYDAQEMAQMAEHAVGHSPPPFPDITGDFSAHGGYYMFHSREEALYWGNSFASMRPPHQFKIVELVYTPPAHARGHICSYPSADQYWEQATRINQGHPPPSAPRCPLVEGPLSRLSQGRYVARTSALTGQILWQYAVVNPQWLPVMRITRINTYYTVSTWHNNPQQIPRAFAHEGNWHRVCPGCHIQ